MCMLCQAQWYQHPGTAQNRDKLQAQALKARIELHEKTLREQLARGETPCEASQERLKALRAEQYDLSKRI